MGQVPCEETRCETCGKIVAFLLFADDATDAGLFDDLARLMNPHYARHNVPTYHRPGTGRRPDGAPPSEHSQGVATA